MKLYTFEFRPENSLLKKRRFKRDETHNAFLMSLNASSFFAF
jgi:hypothetical protein